MSFFISFEGLDKAGKSTQVAMLSQYFTEKKRDHIVIREPGATLVGEKIRLLLLSNESRMHAETEAYLYAAARAELVREMIKPSLAAGKIVICDRFVDSSLAYQGFARELGFENVLSLNQMALQEAMPDFTFLLECELSESETRMVHDDKDRLENEAFQFKERVQEAYLFLKNYYNDRIYPINGNASKEEVHQKIVSIINEKIILC